MKKYLFLILGIFIISKFSIGQSLKSTSILVGLNHSFLNYEKSFDKLLDKELKIGLALGLSGKFSIYQNIKLDLDVLFIQKGDKYSVVNGTEFRDLVLKTLNFISLSPVIKYIFVKDSYWPYLVLGPNINFLISGKAKSDAIGSIDMKSDLNNFSYDLILGIGFEILQYGFKSEVRYYYGLSNIPKKGWIDFNTQTISLFIVKEINIF